MGDAVQHLALHPHQLVVSALSGACSGVSNFSHDIGGYLGHRLVERCSPELLIRWIQFGCFMPLMHARGRMAQEPWNYGERVMGLYRAYVHLHEQLVPYVRAAARTAAQSGLPIIRPLCLIDPFDARGWSITDAYGYGPALWVAPVLDADAREREVALPRGDWIETWSGREVRGGGEAEIPAPLERIPVWVRSGSIVVSYRPEDVSAGLGDVPEGERPLVATLWGTPRLGRRAVRVADGTRIAWQGGRLAVTEQRSRREVALVHRPPSGRPGAARCARCARPRARSAARSRRSSWTASPGSWRLAEPSRPAASWRWAEWRPVGSRWAPPVALSATTEGRPRCG